MTLVIDASITLPWYFEDEATALTEAALDAVVKNGALVPPLWRIEVANAFRSAIRRKRIAPDYRDAALADLQKLAVALDTDADGRVWTTVLSCSDRFGLTIYDACYLELAHRMKLPLATLDAELRKAAMSLGVGLFDA